MKWDQSAPFTSTSGKRAAISSRGVSSSNKTHGVDGFERQRHLRPFAFAQYRTRRSLHPPHGLVGVQAQDQHIAQRPGLLERANVPRMKQIEAPIGKDYRFAFDPPAPPLFDQLRATVERSHRFSVARGTQEDGYCGAWQIAYN